MAVGIVKAAANDGIGRGHPFQERFPSGCGASVVADFKHVGVHIAGYETLGVLLGVTGKKKRRISVYNLYNGRIIICVVIFVKNGGEHLNAQPVAVDQCYSCFGRVYRKSFFVHRVKNVLERLCVRRYLWHIYAFHVKGPYYIVQSSDMILVRMGANHIIYGRISKGLYVIYHIGPGLICSRVYEQGLAVWQFYKLAVSLTNIYEAHSQRAFSIIISIISAAHGCDDRVILRLGKKFLVFGRLRSGGTGGKRKHGGKHDKR